jgi:hypothetical protein
MGNPDFLPLAVVMGHFLPPLRGLGAGVISETRALPGAVIPAKAGIYSARRWKCAADGLDSRFRGNDPCFDRDLIPNDTSTPGLPPLASSPMVCFGQPMRTRGFETESRGPSEQVRATLAHVGAAYTSSNHQTEYREADRAEIGSLAFLSAHR